MKYKTGDYLAARQRVLFRVVGSIKGAVELYAVATVKSHTVGWYSLSELKHEGFALAFPDFHEFDTAQSGDFVAIGDDENAKILARTNDAILLSVSAGLPRSPIFDLMADALVIGPDGQPMSQESIEHHKVHDTASFKYGAAGDWYDTTTMVLLNWKLVRE